MNRGPGRYPISPLEPALFKDSSVPILTSETVVDCPGGTPAPSTIASSPGGGVPRTRGGDPLDERMERLDIRDVLSAQPGESGADLLVEPDAVRREPVPELPGESTPADVPIRQDDRLFVAPRDRLAQPENRRAFVDEPEIPVQAEGPQRASS